MCVNTQSTEHGEIAQGGTTTTRAANAKHTKCSVSWRSQRSLVNCMPQEHRGVHLEAQALTTAVPGVAELLEQ